MRRFLGRVFTNPKTHLLGIAEILGFPEELRHRMRKATEDECEALLLSQVESSIGGTVDWRGTPKDIYDVLSPCLTEAERALLPSLPSVGEQPPTKVIATLDLQLQGAPRALRALESFGDFIIILLVPRGSLTRFDQLARHWLA